MAENMNKESEITSTVEDTWFVNIPEVKIKLENAEIQGKLPNFVNFLFLWQRGGGGGKKIL